MNQTWMQCRNFDQKDRCPHFDNELMQNWLRGPEMARIKGPDLEVDQTLQLSLGVDVNKLLCANCDRFQV